MNSMYVHVQLLRDRFEFFTGGSASFVMRTQTMQKILSSVVRQMRSEEGMLRLCVVPGERTFAVCLIDDTGKEGMSYTLPCNPMADLDRVTALTEIQQNGKLMFTPGTYQKVVYLNARHLSHLVSHVFPLGDVIEVACDADMVHFGVANPHAMISRGSVRFRASSDSQEKGTHMSGHRFTFRQGLLSMLLRAMSLHATTAMCLPAAPGMPALVEANVADLGRLSVAIAQVSEEDASS
jgi:hypothetical protein